MAAGFIGGFRYLICLQQGSSMTVSKISLWSKIIENLRPVYEIEFPEFNKWNVLRLLPNHLIQSYKKKNMYICLSIA
jgi:hypothetical protein